MSSPVDDAIRAGAAQGAEAGVLAAMLNPAFRDLLRAEIRAAVGEVVPNLLRPEEVERRYGIPRSSQRRMRSKGQLRTVKLGRTVLVDVSTLTAR